MSKADLPLTECLKDTVARFLPYSHETIVPAIRGGKRVLIAAHGNSLRARVKYLDNISDQEIVSLNIPTGVPLVYELDEQLKPGQALLPGRSRGSGSALGRRRRPGESKVRRLVDPAVTAQTLPFAGVPTWPRFRHPLGHACPPSGRSGWPLSSLPTR